MTVRETARRLFNDLAGIFTAAEDWPYPTPGNLIAWWRNR